MVSPKEQVTAQMYDLQFGTNVIGTSGYLGQLVTKIGAYLQVPGYSRSYYYLP
jgi:hypothetical protein